jgi:hypothetical protein
VHDRLVARLPVGVERRLGIVGHIRFGRFSLVGSFRVALDEPQATKLTLSAEGRQIEVELERDGDRIQTRVIETYASAEDAATAYGRIEAAMKADGYT